MTGPSETLAPGERQPRSPAGIELSTERVELRAKYEFVELDGLDCGGAVRVPAARRF